MTDRDEPLPARQEDVPPDVPQRSTATPTGTAESPEAPGPKRQENVPEGIKQRSDTATGTAEIVPG